MWGDQVFLTTAIGAGVFKQPSPGIYGNDYVAELRAARACREAQIMEKLRAARSRVAAGSPATCSSWSTASTSRPARSAGSSRRTRDRRSAAATARTPTRLKRRSTDGERVYAMFGNIGLFCYSMDGKPLWIHISACSIQTTKFLF